MVRGKLTDETSDIQSLLGIDFETLEWQDLALCEGMDTNLFYDDYESDEQVARVVDEVCLSCPVMAQCLARGVENGEWGVWGGVYLTSGRTDDGKNTHKTPEVWNQIKEKING